MFSDQRSYMSIYLLVCVMLIPLFVATVWYFFRNITVPVRKLMTGTDKIRAGEYGWRVESFDGNEEMGHLVDNFNHMAGRLEESFNRIYVEEIAGRDATLKALQSQINPHFLNNTLEIINWKARMNGNEEVSEMISALSTMMNATLNRNDEMFITLREELRYVDAYLYIIRQRFGGRMFEYRCGSSRRFRRLLGASGNKNTADCDGEQRRKEFVERTHFLLILGCVINRREKELLQI